MTYNTDRFELVVAAPHEIPDWFQPAMPGDEQPSYFPAETEHLKLVQMYDYGDISYPDLPVKVGEWVKQRERHRVDLAQWEERRRQQRVFQWPVYWADQVLAILMQPRPGRVDNNSTPD